MREKDLESHSEELVCHHQRRPRVCRIFKQREMRVSFRFLEGASGNCGKRRCVTKKVKQEAGI